MHNERDLTDGILDIEAELAKFERAERERLGLTEVKSDHWWDPVPSHFTAKQREHTTLWVSGLTIAHDLFATSALRGIGYKVATMDVPNNAALQYGREFGNRGQCNPTYFTVGNLIKHLHEMEARGMSREDIIENNVFVTAGACGPCRFGTYVTEYRKALRDSGFDGFRVLLFQQTGMKQATGEELGLEVNQHFAWALIKAFMVGDVLNALGYRTRPYEVASGATDKAMDECKKLICVALETKSKLFPTLYECRKIMASVKVDRTRVVPKVAIIGEFWAMTTEGDGNYGMQRFLEAEGAEVEIQLVTAWILYMVWQGQYDTERRAELRGSDEDSDGLGDTDVRKLLLMLAAGNKIVRGMFQVFANVMGLHGYHLPDMDEMAEVSHAFYDNNLRGGEGHMEIGKLILNVAKSKVNMTLSVKPFGCMPSSSVSDGVQSMITELYPQGIFLPIETNGDGAVNVYSRVQMQLFKAKQAAQRDVDDALAEAGLTMEEVRAYLNEHPKLQQSLHHPDHEYGCTAADMVREVGRRNNRLETVRHNLTARWRNRKGDTQTLAAIARIAATKVARAKARAVLTEQSREAVEGGAPPIPKGRMQLRVIN